MKPTIHLKIRLIPLLAALLGTALAGDQAVAAGSSVSRSVSVTSDGRTTIRKTTTTRDGVTETVTETTGPDGKTTVTREGGKPGAGDAEPQAPPAGNRAVAGLRVKEAEPVLREQLGLGENEGVVVDLVDPNGPSAAAGIIAHDIILRLDDRPLGTPADFRAILRDRQPGDKVGFSLLRKGKPGRASVTLAATEEPPDDRDGPAATRRLMDQLGIGNGNRAEAGGTGGGAVKIEIKGDGNDALDLLLDDPDVPESVKRLLRNAAGGPDRPQQREPRD